MANKTVTSQTDFDLLLDWLDNDRETAARKYEKIRQRLIQIFCGRGCYEAEELADITFDRVTTKLPSIIETYTGKPALYFYGTANNVYHEWIRKQTKQKQVELEDAVKIKQNTEANAELDCLEQCLEKLPAEQRNLVIGYYRENKSSKIKIRKQLAEKLGVNSGTLQIRLHRIRQGLRKCIAECMAKKS
jgi:RNA polymerase sigma factor (sigma-70 family)